jgi:hypothetical protein
MAVKLPNGSRIYIASGYGTSKTMSALSNANPAVATLEASHGVIVGDFLEVTSGWSRLTDKIVRASAVATNDVSLEGIDSTLTSIYPAGTGTGTVREVSGWTQLAQIMGSTSAGGEQQFYTYAFLEADGQTQIPTTKTPGSMTLTMADDPTLAGYIAASAANDDRLARAIRIVLANGSILLFNAYVSVNKIPTLTRDEAMQVTVTLSFLGEPVRYAS